MVNEISQEKAQIVYAMEQQLRNNLLHSDTNKLWENTYIKRQIDKRKENSSFSVNDHIRAMVYSMLSSGVAWNRIAENADIATGHIRDVDEIFCNYSPKQLLKCTPEQLGNSLNKIHCASQYTFKQMSALLEVNIPKLLDIENEYGTVDTYYQKFVEIDKTLHTLVLVLSNIESKDKLAQMGIALVCEYLRNVGYDIPKPDRHIRRILGSETLAFSSNETATPFEVFDIVSKIAVQLNKSIAEVDYILWSYCANGYGEICTVAKPKCDICVAKKYCKKEKQNG